MVYTELIDGKYIDMDVYSFGEGSPCTPGCVVELEYIVRDVFTRSLLITDQAGKPVVLFFKFTVGDGNIPEGKRHRFFPFNF